MLRWTLRSARPHQDGESVKGGEFHPQVLLSLLRPINLHCSVLSGPHFVIKCRNFLVCLPRSPLSVIAARANAFPLFPERLLSRSHLRSEMNLLLPVGWVWTANEREICSYREKVSHAPGLKNQPWVTMGGGKKPTLSAALAGNDRWHPVWQSQNDVLFLLNKRRKKNIQTDVLANLLQI